MTIRIANIRPNELIIDKRGRATPRFMQLINDLIARTGGQGTDAVADALREAAQAAADTSAINAGAGGGGAGAYTLSPAFPLSYELLSATSARIVVSAHTRTETSPVTLSAGSVTGLDRGPVYYVYYDDPTNAGGAVTYEASRSAGDTVGTGRKYIGALAIPSGSYSNEYYSIE